MKRSMKIIRNQKGQGLMEYIIISSLVGIFCLVAMKQFGESVHTRVQKMKKDIVKHIPVR